MDWEIQLCELNYDNSESEAVSKIMSSEWLTMGPETKVFENEFSAYIGHKSQGVFVSSATAGLHLILMAMGLGVGDEVIIPALTFVSDANVVKQLGGSVVFADSISENNFNVSEADIISKITERTKAIVVVHFAGFPMLVDKLKEVCVEKNIFLVEDCAHAPGAKIGERCCGTFGHFSFFSFFSNKNLAVGEGGMVFSEDATFSDKIRAMRSHGMSSVTLDRHLGRTSSYDVTSEGLNYRPDEIRAAIGRAQLKKLDDGNAKRNELFQRYRWNLDTTDIIVPFAKFEEEITSSYHIMPVLLPKSVNREQVMSQMRNAKIQTSIHYPSFRSFGAYRDVIRGVDTPVADFICNHELTLPLHPRMSIENVDKVTSVLLESI